MELIRSARVGGSALDQISTFVVQVHLNSLSLRK